MTEPARSPAAILDAAHRELTSGTRPGVIAMPAADWAALSAAKTRDGRPIFAPGPARIWGTPVVLTPAETPPHE